MGSVVYTKLPPVMAAIKDGDIEALRALLDAGHAPDEPQRYLWQCGNMDREGEAAPLELAVIEGRKDMAELLISRGADISRCGDELLYASLRGALYGEQASLSMFAFLIDAGARISAKQDSVSRLFLHLENYRSADILPLLDRLGMNLEKFGGEPLRAMASSGNRMLAEYLLDNGADINYHKPDMVFPYASTPVTEAARRGDFEMVRFLVEHGADVTIADKYGDRPYTLAVQSKNQEMADYLRALEPEDWHNEQEKARQLKPYKLPAAMAEYLKTGPLRLEFPEYELTKWAELYSYMDVQETVWKRRKLLSIMTRLDNYDGYMLLWSPKDKRLWYLDEEHEEFHPLAAWDDFIAAPGRYLNCMIEGEFEE